jgi:hypothetical protein
MRFLGAEMVGNLMTFLLCFGFSTALMAVEISDSTSKSTPTLIKGNLQLTNNGISNVPYFTLGEPALLTNLFVTKGRFSFTPAFNFDLKAKPWSFNTWMHYRVIQSKRFNLYIGSNFSTVFRRRDPNLFKEDLQTQRYQMSEINITYKIDPKKMLNLFYWKTTTLDNLGIKSSHFVSLAIQFEDLLKNEDNVLSFNPSIFVIDNTLPFSGLFMSQIIKFSTKKIPLIFSFQAVETLQSNVAAKFNWNMGVNVPF